MFMDADILQAMLYLQCNLVHGFLDIGLDGIFQIEGLRRGVAVGNISLLAVWLEHLVSCIPYRSPP